MKVFIQARRKSSLSITQEVFSAGGKGCLYWFCLYKSQEKKIIVRTNKQTNTHTYKWRNDSKWFSSRTEHQMDGFRIQSSNKYVDWISLLLLLMTVHIWIILRVWHHWVNKFFFPMNVMQLDLLVLIELMSH